MCFYGWFPFQQCSYDFHHCLGGPKRLSKFSYTTNDTWFTYVILVVSDNLPNQGGYPNWDISSAIE